MAPRNDLCESGLEELQITEEKNKIKGVATVFMYFHFTMTVYI